MLDRRRFLGAVALPAVTAAAVLRPERALAAVRAVASASGSPAAPSTASINPMCCRPLIFLTA